MFFSPVFALTLPLIACPECDLLQREIALPPGGAARCGRCGNLLYRNLPDSIERTLALVLAAIVLFVVSNSFPIAALEVRGDHTETTLLGAVHVLYEQDKLPVAVLVFITTVLAPALELGAMLYMLLPLYLGRIPTHLPLAFRLVPAAREWGFVDVFMLGVLVALIKLGNLATVVPGIAIWSFGALILLLAAAGGGFDQRAIWLRADANRLLLLRDADGTRAAAPAAPS